MEIKRLEYDFSVCKVVDYSQVNLDDEPELFTAVP